MDTFGSPLLEDVQLNADGTLKNSGKQNVKFYNKKVQSFRAKKDEKGVPIIDPKTGLPFKEYFEENREMIRVETRGDTNIIDDFADPIRKAQFGRHYRYFKSGKMPEGNPIEDFEFIQPATLAELHASGVHVIQQVATMEDLVCDMMKDQSGYELRDIAAQWVRVNSPQSKSQKEAKLQSEVDALKAQVAALKGDGPATMEISADELKAGRKSRKRLVA